MMLRIKYKYDKKQKINKIKLIFIVSYDVLLCGSSGVWSVIAWKKKSWGG